MVSSRRLHESGQPLSKLQGGNKKKRTMTYMSWKRMFSRSSALEASERSMEASMLQAQVLWSSGVSGASRASKGL